MKRILTSMMAVVLLGSTSFAADEPASSRRSGKVTIPVIELKGVISEKPAPDDFPFAFGGAQPQSLYSVLKRIEKVAEDDSIPAMVLQINGPVMGRAQAEEIVRALKAVRAAGRNVHIHTNVFHSAGRLVLMSAATDISMIPTGYMFITGLYAEQVFIRGMLDKIGVTPDFFTCGDFKGADEMFMRKEPSEESAEMTKWLIDGIFENMLMKVAEGRGVNQQKVQSWIDEGVFTAEHAKESGIIDFVEHTQDFEDRLREKYGDDLKFDRRYGKKSAQQIDLSSPFGILNFYAELLAPSKPRKSTAPAVGIVYLEGAIMDGNGGGNPLFEDSAAFGEKIRRALDEAARDDAIKAVVFRVNSPGGSAAASEVILNAAKRIAAKKPLIVSMGNVAASGGYYVSCATDTIFAEESTITGSIGVVAGKFATRDLWNNLGITFTPVTRGRNAAMLRGADVFSDSERAAMKGYMDEVYEIFKGHVTAIRGDRLSKPIDDIAGGRVYTGRQALENGLVDKIGGLTEAIAFAAEKAKLGDDYEVRVVPRTKGFMELLMSDMTGPKDDQRHLSLSSGTAADMSSMEPVIDGLLPLLKTVDPARAAVLRQVVQQLFVVQNERVSLTAPVMLLAE